MPSWTPMADLEMGDIVTEADMDAIRGNIEYLLNPNGDTVNQSGPYTISTTSYADVDSTNLKITFETNGGFIFAQSQVVWDYISTSMTCSSATAIDNAIPSNAEQRSNVNVSVLILSQTVGVMEIASVASHTVAIQAKVFSGSAYLNNLQLFAYEF